MAIRNKKRISFSTWLHDIDVTHCFNSLNDVFVVDAKLRAYKKQGEKIEKVLTALNSKKIWSDNVKVTFEFQERKAKK